jgi:hypothetical protein
MSENTAQTTVTTIANTWQNQLTIVVKAEQSHEQGHHVQHCCEVCDAQEVHCCDTCVAQDMHCSRICSAHWRHCFVVFTAHDTHWVTA